MRGTTILLLIAPTIGLLSCSSNHNPKYGLEQLDQCAEVPVGVTIDKGQLDLASAKIGDFSLGKLDIVYTPEFQKVISEAATNALVQDHLVCKAIVRAKVHGNPEMVSYFMRLTHFLSKERTVAEQIQWQQTNPIPGAARLKPTEGFSGNAERDRRNKLLLILRNEYIASHDNISPRLMAGTEWPPLDWMKKRLVELGESWSVMPGKNSMELLFVEGQAGNEDYADPNPIAQWGTGEPGTDSIHVIVNTLKLKRYVDEYRMLVLYRVASSLTEARDDHKIVKSAVFNITGDRKAISTKLTQEFMQRLIPSGGVQIYLLLLPAHLSVDSVMTVNDALTRGAILMGTRAMRVSAVMKN